MAKSNFRYGWIGISAYGFDWCTTVIKCNTDVSPYLWTKMLLWNLHRFMKICLKMQSAHENNWLKKCLTFKKNFCSRWMCVVVKSDKDPIILYQKMLDLFKFLQKYSYFRQSLLPLKEHLIKLNDLY